MINATKKKIKQGKRATECVGGIGYAILDDTEKAFLRGEHSSKFMVSGFQLTAD